MASTPQPTPTWRPISWLPTISAAIRDGLATSQEFHGTLEQGWERPYRMDEATLARVRRVYSEQAEDVELYAEQLCRWQAGSMSVAQRQEVDELAGQVKQWRNAVAAGTLLADRPSTLGKQKCPVDSKPTGALRHSCYAVNSSSAWSLLQACAETLRIVARVCVHYCWDDAAVCVAVSASSRQISADHRHR